MDGYLALEVLLLHVVNNKQSLILEPPPVPVPIKKTIEGGWCVGGGGDTIYMSVFIRSL